MRYFCHDDMIAMVHAECADGNQKDYAKRVGISASYLSDFLNSRRDPGPKLLKALGFEDKRYYRKAEK